MTRTIRLKVILDHHGTKAVRVGVPVNRYFAITGRGASSELFHRQSGLKALGYGYSRKALRQLAADSTKQFGVVLRERDWTAVRRAMIAARSVEWITEWKRTHRHL